MTFMCPVCGYHCRPVLNDRPEADISSPFSATRLKTSALKDTHKEAVAKLDTAVVDALASPKCARGSESGRRGAATRPADARGARRAAKG
jgi:hypothetical protein